MPTPVVMPQMGESIAEGTIVRWIKKVGDTVDRDEPLFEISTDKVDAEIPSPAAGVLTEISAQEGETVAVNAVVATIGEAGSAVAPAVAEGDSPANAPRRGAEQASRSTQPQGDGAQTADASAQENAQPATAASAPRPTGANGGASVESGDDLRRHKSSPLVRRIAREHNVDIEQLHGSGIGGRVTKHDILEYLDGHPAGEQPAAPERVARSTPAAPPAYGPGDRVEIQPLSIIRRKIAEHMVLSRRTSAHVHSVFHVNFSTVEKIRQQKKAD